MAGPDGASAGAGVDGPCATRVAKQIPNPKTQIPNTNFMAFSSTRRARSRMPAAGVHTLEMRAGPVRRGQVFGIDDLGGDDQQRVTAGNIEPVEVFRHH